MEIYKFNKNSPISHIEFTQDAKHVWLGHMFAQPGTAPAQLSDIPAKLNEKSGGLIATPQSDKDAHSLYVSGFSSPQILLNRLKSLHITNGKPTREVVSEEAATFTTQMRDASLKMAGIFYLISDAALIVSGLLAGRGKEAMAGLLYSSGGVILTGYGRKDAHTYLRDTTLNLGKFLEKEGVELPKNGPITAQDNDQRLGLVKSLEKFAYRYPSQIFNTIVATCGVQIIRSGKQHKKDWDVYAGSFVLAGALLGLLIPEKPQLKHGGKPPPPPNGVVEKIIDWAREKPLRLPGVLWFMNNIAFTVSAIKERKSQPNQYSYMFKFGYAAAAVIANGLMYISSKQENKRFDIDSECMQALFSSAANTLMAQPPQAREKIIEDVSEYLAAQNQMSCTKEQISAMIHSQLEGLKNNPFQAPAQAEPSAKATVSFPMHTKHVSPKKPADWSNAFSKSEENPALVLNR